MKKHSEMRKNDHYFLGSNGNLKILGKTARGIHPSKSSLYNPTPGKLFPFTWFDSLRNVDRSLKIGFHFINKSPAITCICTETLYRRVLSASFLRYSDARLRVVKIRCMNYDRQQIAHCVYNDVPLSAFCFFPPSIPRSSLSATVFTL